MMYNNRVLYWMSVLLMICSVAVDCQSVEEKLGIENSLRKQMTVSINYNNDDTSSQSLNPHTTPTPQQQPTPPQQSCKQNFIYNNSTNTCTCPQQNNFIYIQSSQQCKCFLGQIRINIQDGSKICQKTQQINIGLFCLGLVIDFFIIYGIYKCCCSKGTNDGGYRRQGEGNRKCERGFVKCLCWCLFHKGNNEHHHHRDHHHKHHHHNRDHHNNHHKHHHNNTSPSLLTQQ